MKAIILSLAVLLIANSANLYCRADAEEVETVKETFSVPASTGHAFLETFQDDPFSRWTESSDSSYDGQKWAHEARKETSDLGVDRKKGVRCDYIDPKTAFKTNNSEIYNQYYDYFSTLKQYKLYEKYF